MTLARKAGNPSLRRGSEGARAGTADDFSDIVRTKKNNVSGNGRIKKWPNDYIGRGSLASVNVIRYRESFFREVFREGGQWEGISDLFWLLKSLGRKWLMVMSRVCG